MSSHMQKINHALDVKESSKVMSPDDNEHNISEEKSEHAKVDLQRTLISPVEPNFDLEFDIDDENNEIDNLMEQQLTSGAKVDPMPENIITLGDDDNVSVFAEISDDDLIISDSKSPDEKVESDDSDEPKFDLNDPSSEESLSDKKSDVAHILTTKPGEYKNDLELMNNQNCIALLLRKQIMNTSEFNITEFNNILARLKWLYATSMYFCEVLGLEKIELKEKKNEIVTVIPRSSYNFCNNRLCIQDRYYKKLDNPRKTINCKFAHFPHNKVSNDIYALIKYIEKYVTTGVSESKGCSSEELPPINLKEISTSIVTIAFTINHMYNELSILSAKFPREINNVHRSNINLQYHPKYIIPAQRNFYYQPHNNYHRAPIAEIKKHDIKEIKRSEVKAVSVAVKEDVKTIVAKDNKLNLPSDASKQSLTISSVNHKKQNTSGDDGWIAYLPKKQRKNKQVH